MTDNLISLIDKNRLADVSLEKEKKISFFIEKQFPAIYRENGQELIELVKSYYRFLEENDKQSIYNARRIYEYRNIDTTLEKMLIFFKNKFLDGLFFEKDIRFIVKNILDLYRSKGSKEGIELFFKMFFDSEVSIYFPSEDLFKPSTSLWKTGSFIQLYGVTNTKIFDDIVNKKIFGDKSKAEAFVDNIYFLNIDSASIPILFISSISGRFQGFDVIFSNDPIKVYGRVYGSTRNVTVIDEEAFTGNNKVGDIVNVVSNTGKGAKGRVSKVTQELSGLIEFQIINGGFGYTEANTDIELSTQTIFFADPDSSVQSDPIEFFIGERVEQINSANTLVEGTVIGQKRTAVGIKLDFTTPDAVQFPETYLFEPDFNVSTVNRIENISFPPVFTTPPNSSASAAVGENSISNTESITIITDLIENYLNVPLDSQNYSDIPPALLEMSGTRVNGIIPNLSTPLNEAFVPEDFVIGEITRLVNINPGQYYFADSFVLARENLISRFGLRNQVLRIIQSPGVGIFVDDIITQKRNVKTFEGATIEIEVRGRVVNTIGNEIFITQLTFESFVVEEPIFKSGIDIPIVVVSRSRDQSSRPIGLNADINANVETISGKIEEIEIIESGFGYVDQSIGEVYNLTKAEREDIESIFPDCLVKINARDQGTTEGRWVSFFSHISQEKVIQDSLFYQDYSYQITTDITPENYEKEYKELVHTTGIKLFTAFGKTDNINIETRLRNIEFSFYKIDNSTDLIAEYGSSIVTENGFGYLNSQFVELDPPEFIPVIIDDIDDENGEADIAATADTIMITADSTEITADSI